MAKPAVADNPKEPSTPTPATASSTTTSSAPAPAPVAAVTQSPESGATAAAAFNDPSALATGSARESAIANMIEMGYDRQEVNRAMRAAFNNPDRAVEYLLTGIPEDLSRETAPPPPAGPETTTPATAPASVTDSTTSTPALPSTATPSQQQQQQPPSSQQQTQNQPFNMFEAAAQTQRPGGSAPSAAPAAAAAGAGIGENAGVSLDYLRDNPQFQQLRNLLQQQPQLLEPILQQLAQGNPQLATLINSQPEAFLQLLAEGGGEGVLPGEGGGEGGAGAQQIQITEAERDAIGRLEGLGFSRDLVIQAYFACDKNEELAGMINLALSYKLTYPSQLSSAIWRRRQ